MSELSTCESSMILNIKLPIFSYSNLHMTALLSPSPNKQMTCLETTKDPHTFQQLHSNLDQELTVYVVHHKPLHYTKIQPLKFSTIGEIQNQYLRRQVNYKQRNQNNMLARKSVLKSKKQSQQRVREIVIKKRTVSKSKQQQQRFNLLSYSNLGNKQINKPSFIIKGKQIIKKQKPERQRNLRQQQINAISPLYSPVNLQFDLNSKIKCYEQQQSYYTVQSKKLSQKILSSMIDDGQFEISMKKVVVKTPEREWRKSYEFSLQQQENTIASRSAAHDDEKYRRQPDSYAQNSASAINQNKLSHNNISVANFYAAEQQSKDQQKNRYRIYDLPEGLNKQRGGQNSYDVVMKKTNENQRSRNSSQEEDIPQKDLSRKLEYEKQTRGSKVGEQCRQKILKSNFKNQQENTHQYSTSKDYYGKDKNYKSRILLESQSNLPKMKQQSQHLYVQGIRNTEFRIRKNNSNKKPDDSYANMIGAIELQNQNQNQELRRQTAQKNSQIDGLQQEKEKQTQKNEHNQITPKSVKLQSEPKSKMQRNLSISDQVKVHLPRSSDTQMQVNSASQISQVKLYSILQIKRCHMFLQNFLRKEQR